jgi:3-oxoadipate enol-lactonase
MLLRCAAAASNLSLRLMGARRVRREIPPASIVLYRLGPPDGEPWLLLHGMGSIAGSWVQVIGEMRRDCRLLVPELSQLGGTRAPGGGIGVANAADYLARLLEAELGRSPRATVAGLSLGGWMAVRLALARPDLVARLVLIDAGGYRHQDWDRIQQLVTVSDLAGVDRLYGEMFVRTPWILRHSRQGFLRSYTSPGVLRVLTDTTEDDVFDDADLARLTMPTALIWGERDGLFQLETARAMAAALPQARLEVVPDCGHALHLECPGRLAAALQRFRQATSLPAPLVRPETA